MACHQDSGVLKEGQTKEYAEKGYVEERHERLKRELAQIETEYRAL
jgi:hypothetical protein